MAPTNTGIENASNVPWRQPFAPLVEKEGTRWGRLPQKLHPRLPAPPRQGHKGRFVEWHDPLLAALAEHPDEPRPLVQVIEVESAQLTDANSGAVEDFADGAVSNGQRPSSPIGIQELVQLFANDQFGQFLGRLWRPRPVAGESAKTPSWTSQRK